MGKTSFEKGKFREFLIKERLKKPFNLKDIAQNGIDLEIKPKNIIERKKVQLGLLEREIDLIIEGNKEIWIDIKDTERKYGKAEADRWLEIKEAALKENKKIIFMAYSQSGYTKGMKERLISEGVYIAL